MSKDQTIKDSEPQGWVEHMPTAIRPYLRLARYDRPIGFWLLALPGWIGLAFAGLSWGLVWDDLKWALLIGVGAVAMRGAGCTYNDIIDRDLDAQVERTALRPLPAGSVSVKQAWIWLIVQCLIGAVVLAFFPRLAQIIALCSLGLVAAYPFMKRITYWPQAWLGLTFNWAVLVAYTAKTGEIAPALGILYLGLVFWTIGYDTIYACQDIEDDAMIGVMSTARRFGSRVKGGVAACYGVCIVLTAIALGFTPYRIDIALASVLGFFLAAPELLVLPFAAHLFLQIIRLNPQDETRCLSLFKSNRMAAIYLIAALLMPSLAQM